MRRTIADWLTHAAAAPDATEAERCLTAAVAEAKSCHDWRTILRGISGIPLATRERVTDVANRALATAVTEREVWGFRDVATARATRLDDVEGARAALEAGVAAFLEPRTDLLGKPEHARAYEWVLLGKGFLETLHDPGGMRRCLEAGRDGARSAEETCDIATAWAEHVDHGAAVALLLDAEGRGGARPWTLANAWYALGDSSAVRRVLDAALEGAVSCDAALHVASAWASHRAPDQVRRALARAQKLATTAHDWLEIGESAFDAGLGDAPVRLAVERAEAMSTDDDEKGRVSRAYRDWLHDEEAATRLGPRGVRPEALRRHVRTLPGWETSASDLFDWLRARATPEVLTHIAKADYGMDFDKHLAALRDICETGLVPRTLGWEPHEVLALTRWSTGENVDHLARALSCTLLCLPPDNMDDLVTNGAILAESCLALGPEASHLAERFFAWRSETEADVEDPEDDDVGPEQPVALLLLYLLRTAAVPDDPRLEGLAKMLTDHPTYELLNVAVWMEESLRADLWTDLVDRVLVPMASDHPPTARVLHALGR